MQNPVTIIHIGANKTASTTFQRNCFIKLPGLVYRGEEDPRFQEYGSIIDSIINDDEHYYNQEAAVSFFKTFMAEKPERVHLFSYEDISRSRVPSLCSARLAQCLPGAKILFVVRNQIEAVKSWYFNHGAFLRDVPHPHWRRYVNFNNWFEYQLKFPKYSHLAAFDYKNILGPYEKFFGRENIQVLLYEEFIKSPRIFCSKIADLLKLDAGQVLTMVEDKWERKRPTQWQHYYQRFFGRLWPIKWDNINNHSPWFARAINAVTKVGPPSRFVFNADQQKVISHYYRESNRYIRDVYRLPLDTYGYPLP